MVVFSAKHIGQFLEEEFLKPLDLSQSDLAKAISVPRARISDIVTGKRSITPDTDLRLCKYLGLTDGYFLKVQTLMELEFLKIQMDEDLSHIQPLQDAFGRTILFPAKQERLDAPKKVHIGLICGGPSMERGISLNSARSVMDHLSTQNNVEIHPFYVDFFKEFYKISKGQLYSNTPSDFDFKLAHTATKLSGKNLIQALKEMDIVFPVIHGAFGEDGELQAFLEKNDIPFVGPDSQTCQKMFRKDRASKILKDNGYHVLPIALLKLGDVSNEEKIRSFFAKHELKRAIVKPSAGGSSIGVFSINNAEEAIEKMRKIFDMGIDNQVLLEPFCYGKEFTIIVLQNPDGTPVALIPSEIQVSYENGGIFDYRRKYLPNSNTKWPCPPHFDDSIVDQIREVAERLFTLFGMRDFARLDGWLLNDGRLLFSDFNPISGMEQNSFIFEQSSRVGMTHQDLLWNLICKACHREGVKIVEEPRENKISKRKVRVIFGGRTAERQVSLMSGTNAWLKLRQSKVYAPEPYFLDPKGYLWHLPYTYALNHTAEEVYDNCLTAYVTSERLEKYTREIRRRLAFLKDDYDVKAHLPKKFTFDTFLKEAKEENAFIFLGLHGGEGENGVVQHKLDDIGLLYNGSGPTASELCMDKYLTGEAVAKIGDPQITIARKKKIQFSKFSRYTLEDYRQFWQRLQDELQSETFIIKPQDDGCSAGVVHLYEFEDLQKYALLVNHCVPYVMPGTFKNQTIEIEMSQNIEAKYIIESFIEADRIYIQKNELIYEPKTGWLELTIGVLESKGHYHALNPSIAVAEGEVLSLEEKFQGGTGVNITPPPEHIISKKSLQKIKSSIEKVAKALNIENYARLDLFFNVKTDTVLIIEANSLPGLTAATVIYHQALAEENSMPPLQFLERIIQLKEESCV